MTHRERLSNRRASETFGLECAGRTYICTISRYPDGRIAEVFVSNHKNGSSADINARDAAVCFSFAVQHRADPEAIRRALCGDSQGRASGPLAIALDLIAQRNRGRV